MLSIRLYWNLSSLPPKSRHLLFLPPAARSSSLLTSIDTRLVLQLRVCTPRTAPSTHHHHAHHDPCACTHPLSSQRRGFSLSLACIRRPHWLMIVHSDCTTSIHSSSDRLLLPDSPRSLQLVCRHPILAVLGAFHGLRGPALALHPNADGNSRPALSLSLVAATPSTAAAFTARRTYATAKPGMPYHTILVLASLPADLVPPRSSFSPHPSRPPPTPKLRSFHIHSNSRFRGLVNPRI